MKVRKRDGRLETYDQSKIVNAITRAAKSLGYGEELLSEELASVVTLFIENEFSEGVSPIQEIQEMVERVLMETGHSDIARAFILHRERRERLKDVIQVRDSDTPFSNAEHLAVDSGESATLSPWSKGRIVSALMTEAELPVSLASEIASEVENRVFQSGLTRMSSSLIRELVDNELFNRGLSGSLLNQALLGVPGYDVSRLVESDSEGKTPTEVIDKLSGSILRQYALRKIYTPEESEAHKRGDTLIEGLECPSGYLDINLDPTLLPPPYGGTQSSVEALAACIRFLQRFVARSVCVDIMDAVILAYTTQGITPEEYAKRLLSSLASGPVHMQPLIHNPVIALSRDLNEKRARMLKAAQLRGRAALRFMDKALIAFLDAETRIGREVAVPSLYLNLAGAVNPEEDLIPKAVVLEAAGRLTMGMAWKEPSTLAPITPLVGGVVLDMRQCLASRDEWTEETLHDEVQSHLAMAAAILYSKNQFMKRLHRKGRGPKSAIRRYLGGDGDAVGPGYFQLVPSVLLDLDIFLPSQKDQRGLGGISAKLKRFLHHIETMLKEEGKRSGLLIALAAPWVNGSTAAVKERAETPGAAMCTSREWGRFVDLVPLPDHFQGDASDRIAFVRMVMEGLSERGHVS